MQDTAMIYSNYSNNYKWIIYYPRGNSLSVWSEILFLVVLAQRRWRRLWYGTWKVSRLFFQDGIPLLHLAHVTWKFPTSVTFFGGSGHLHGIQTKPRLTFARFTSRCRACFKGQDEASVYTSRCLYRVTYYPRRSPTSKSKPNNYSWRQQWKRVDTDYKINWSGFKDSSEKWR